MSDQDSRSKALRGQADALRSEAKTQRGLMAEKVDGALAEMVVTRDRAARAEYAATEEAKSAAIQQSREQSRADGYRKTATDLEDEAIEAEGRGDAREVEGLREEAEGKRRAAVIAETRVAHAVRDAEDLRVRAAQSHRTVVLTEQAGGELTARANEAERQIDLLEDQARLLDEASGVLAKAEKVLGELQAEYERGDLGNIDPERWAKDRAVAWAGVNSEVDALLNRARAMEVDAEAIVDLSGRPIRIDPVAVEHEPVPPPDDPSTSSLPGTTDDEGIQIEETDDSTAFVDDLLGSAAPDDTAEGEDDGAGPHDRVVASDDTAIATDDQSPAVESLSDGVEGAETWSDEDASLSLGEDLDGENSPAEVWDELDGSSLEGGMDDLAPAPTSPAFEEDSEALDVGGDTMPDHDDELTGFES